MSDRTLPIVVDLDGTLTPADTLHELLARVLSKHPVRTLSIFLKNKADRARLKDEWLALEPSFQPVVPWNDGVLAVVRRFQGNPMVLCTATPQALAERLVGPLNLFGEIHGSTATVNLRGRAKAEFLIGRYGDRGYVYIGNDTSDLEVWAGAAEAYVVSDNVALIAEARRVCPTVHVISPAVNAKVGSWIRLMRPHQWMKNLLVFAPLIASHRMTEGALLGMSCAAFGVFCLLSSSVYVLNDFVDREADRLHPAKKGRPIASGAISPLWAPPLAAVGFGTGLVIAGFIGVELLAAGALYAAVSVLYSLWLKRVAYLDVALLAGLYTLRLLAGTAVTGITPSVWLGCFSMCIFLSLALCKRYTEITLHLGEEKAAQARRSYTRGHAPWVLGLGCLFMAAASAVLAIYTNSPAVKLLYQRPSILWGAVAIMLAWGGRVWWLAASQRMHDDPVLFALRDLFSWGCLAGLATVYFLAT